MNPSTKDDPHISVDDLHKFAKGHKLLVEFIKNLSNPLEKANLTHAMTSYEAVSATHGIDPKKDEHFFPLILRLKNCPGWTWREKFLNVADKIDESEKKSRAWARARSHSRSRSKTAAAASSRPLRAETTNRSVIHQKLDREERKERSRSLDPQQLASRVKLVIEPPRKEDKLALDALLKIFHRSQGRKLMQRTLVLWRARAKRRQELLQGAIQEDHDTLLHQALMKWRDTYCVGVERQHERDQEAHLADLVFLKRYFSKWQNHVIERRQRQYLINMQKKWASERDMLCRTLLQKRDKNNVRHCLRRWSSALLKIRQLEQKALEVERLQVHIFVWSHWVRKYCERVAVNDYSMGLQRRCLLFWLQRTRNMASLVQEADLWRKSNYFDLWMRELVAREAAYNKAVAFDRTKSIQFYISTWRRATWLAQLQYEVQKKSEVVALRRCLRFWSEFAQQRQRLNDLARQARLRTLFNALRRENQATTFRLSSLAISDGYLLRRVLHDWQTRARERSFAARLQLHILRSSLQRWYAKSVDSHYRLQRAEDEVSSIVSTRQIKSCFKHWSSALQHRRQQQDHADVIYEKALKENAIASFREFARKLLIQSVRAKKFERSSTVKRFLRTWHVILINKLEADRHEKLALILKRKETALKVSTWQIWVSRTRHYLDLQQIAIDKRKPRDQAIVMEYFTTWCVRKMNLFELNCKADDFARQKIVATLLKNYQDRVPLIAKANEILDEKERKLTSSLMHIWHAKLRNVQKKKDIADLLNQKLQSDDLRTWLRRWRRKLPRDDSSKTYNEDDSSSTSKDASRSRFLIPFETPSKTPFRKSNRSILPL